MQRHFLNIESVSPVIRIPFTNKKVKWALTKVKMATYSRSLNTLLLSNISCFCSKCARGIFDKCDKLPLHFSLKKVEYTDIIKLFESTQTNVDLTPENETLSENILNPVTELGNLDNNEIEALTDNELNSLDLNAEINQKHKYLKTRLD